MRLRSLTVALLAVLPFSAPFAAAKEHPARAEKFHWSGTMEANQTFSVNGVNGSIDIEPSAGSAVDVVAVKTGKKSDPASVQIEVKQDGGNVTVCALYPGNHCNADGTMTSNVRNNDVQVRFTIRVPDGVRVRARTVNGSIDSRARASDVEAHSVNGSVSCDTRGGVVAHTVNGSVEVTVASHSLSSDMECHTVNGGVTLHLPENVDADLEIENVNGAIEVDFPLSESRMTRHHVEGRIGAGGREIMCKTVNGGVRVSKRGV